MKKIVLTGPPNCGKTMLFNRLTGGHRRVANFPGITTEWAEGKPADADYIIVDLPGTYSLNPASPDEAAAVNYLKNEKYDLIVSVIDGIHPHRGLYLALQLAELKKPMLLAVGMADIANINGAGLDTEKLSLITGIQAVSISAKSGYNLDELKKQITQKQPPCTPALSPKYEEAVKLAELCGKKPVSYGISEKIDSFILSPFFALPFFFFVLFLVFGVIFCGPVNRLGSFCENFFCAFLPKKIFSVLMSAGVNISLAELICDGALKGVGSVLAFLPQMASLFAVLTLLEDSGYMARAAFITDRPLNKIGLCGKSFVPLLMGFGCTTSAVIASKTVSGGKSRFLTVLVLPFISCGARLPIYLLFGKTFFPSRSVIFAALMYLPGLLLMIISAALFSGEKTDESFMLELPSYRLPSFKNVLSQTFILTKNFVVRAGTVIFLASLLMLFLGRLQNVGYAPLTMFTNFFARLLKPLGFGFPQAVSALFSGFFAKEAVVSSLSVLCGKAGIESFFTRASAVSFAVFSAVYPPCITAFSVIRKELGGAYAFFAFIYQLLAAYLCSAAAYFVCTMLA